MIAVAASLGRPALVVTCGVRPAGRRASNPRRGARTQFGAKIDAKIKDAKKSVDRMLEEAKESLKRFETMHKTRLDKLGDIAKDDIAVLKEAFDVDAAHEWGGDEEKEGGPDTWAIDETIDVEFTPHASRGRNDK